jgi:hypothetical protein
MGVSMRKFAICAGLAAVTVAVPAEARAPRPHPAGPHPKPARCEPHAVGYHAHGTLVAVELTQTAGQGTARRGDDRYGGTVQVKVARANHRASTGTQTLTLDNALVRFYDANRDHVADQPKAGDRVHLHGKITKLRRGCSTAGFTPTVTVKYVQYQVPRPPQPHSA